MENSNYIKVLWVGYDPNTKVADASEAAEHHLQLDFCACWNEAKAKLEDNYDGWQAILFDISNNEQLADGLLSVLFELKDIYAKKDWLVHWYILAGNKCPQIPDAIQKEQNKWNAGWTKKNSNIGKIFYSKSTDKEYLYENIKSNAKKSQRILIKEWYCSEYEQLNSLNAEVCDDVFTILETMHFPNSHSDFTPRRFYNPMRKALEYVYRDAQKYGIIPNEFFSNGKVNLNQCFMFLIGNDAEHIGYRYGNPGERIAPRHIQDMMSLIINLGNSSSHSIIENHETELSDEEMQKYDNYMKEIGGDSKMLIFSIALQFCEIVQWMKHYIERNKDKEKNLQKWVELGKTYIVERDKDGLYYAGEYLLNYDKIRWKGRKIKIIASCDNNKENKNIYPYFAYDFKVIEEPKSNSNW